MMARQNYLALRLADHFKTGDTPHDLDFWSEVAGVVCASTPATTDERALLMENLERLRWWCRNQDPTATIWLHIDEAIAALASTPAIDEVERENRRLRNIIAEFGYCTPDATVDFMELIPGEVEAHIAALREQAERIAALSPAKGDEA